MSGRGGPSLNEEDYGKKGEETSNPEMDGSITKDVRPKKPYNKTKYQVIVFLLCFFSYGGFHISRTA